MYLIGIHGKWIVNGVSDAEDKENENAGLSEQQAAIDEFATRHGMPDDVRSEFSTAIRQFLKGGPTGDGDGPLVRNLTEDAYRAFAARFSDVIAEGGHLREVFMPFLKAKGSDVKEEFARQIYIAMERLGADEELLSIFENWSCARDDAQTLSLLQNYNITCERVSSST